MKLAVKGWPNRGVDVLGVGEGHGAAVAQTDLVKAALEFNVVEAVHVLVDDIHSPGMYLHPVDGRDGIAHDLIQQFGPDRVLITSLLNAHSCFRERDCLLLAGGSELTYYATARPYLANGSFPICSILYAVKWDMLFAAYTYTKLLCQPYDVLVAPSAAGREAVEAILGVTSNLTAKSQPVDTVSMPSPQLVNIPLGVDENRFIARDRELARKQFDIPDTAIVILYLGRITEHFKADLEPLLLATSKLVREMPEVCLVLSGQDTQQVYSRMLSELGTVNGISENLRIIPNIAPRLKPFLYSAADIFVSPVDNIQETFGLALLEAMASGLPVVASDWSGYRDIIEDGKEGFLIPTYWNSPVAKIASHFATMMSMSNEYYLAQRTIVDTNLLYDRLRLLAASPELRRECGALGKARVEKLFAWRLVIEKFRNLWLQQLEEFRAAPNPFTSPDHVCFDHDAIFRRYASQSLTVDCRIAADKNLPGGAELLRNRLGYMLNPSLIDAIEMIFEKCSAPQTVGELLKDSDRITAEAVLWLLKKGFCHLLPAF